jgi:hypothetical protein
MHQATLLQPGAEISSGAVLRRGALAGPSSTSHSLSLLRSLLLSGPSAATQFKQPAALRRRPISASGDDSSLRFQHENHPPLNLASSAALGLANDESLRSPQMDLLLAFHQIQIQNLNKGKCTHWAEVAVIVQ